MPKPPSQFTCAMCGGVFDNAWSDSDALMEFQEVFTEEMRTVDTRPPVVVCDLCYNQMLSKITPEEWLARLKAQGVEVTFVKPA